MPGYMEAADIGSLQTYRPYDAMGRKPIPYHVRLPDPRYFNGLKCFSHEDAYALT